MENITRKLKSVRNEGICRPNLHKNKSLNYHCLSKELFFKEEVKLTLTEIESLSIIPNHSDPSFTTVLIAAFCKNEHEIISLVTIMMVRDLR